MKRRFFIDALHVFALSGFAVAQPIYDLIGQNAEFFVAHRVGPLGILAFVALLSFGLPSALVLVEFLARRLGQAVQKILHLGIVCLLFSAAWAPLLNKVAVLPGLGPLFVAFLFGIALTGLYARYAGFQSFLTIASPGVLVFPFIFLAFSHVSGLMLPPELKSNATVAVKNPVPIVFVVFDEFESGALLDASRNVDPVRFPNFAALADQSWWFPRATTVWAETQRAVPAILTGVRPVHAGPPTLQNHPNNLFTWLQNSYRFNVQEPLTNLCPPEACRDTESAEFRPRTFISDLAVIYLHILLPPSVASEALPRMDATWAGFASASPNGAAASTRSFAGEVNKIASGDRRDQFRSFIKKIQAGNTLNFLHVLLPHTPHVYLPSGSIYLSEGSEGLLGKAWANDEYWPTLAYQRYLLQLGMLDSLIGDLVRHLKETGLYDSTLIILTADHGKSFLPGQLTRAIAPSVKLHASEMFQVPLFVKLPGQVKGQRSERYVQTVDIMPTIADVLETEMPWKTDGASAIAPTFPERNRLEIKPLNGAGANLSFELDQLTSYPRLPWKLETFGSRTPLERISIASPYSRLVGMNITQGSDIGQKLTLEAVSEQFSHFDDVDPSSGIVPALLRGEIKGNVPGKGPLHLAVALNGQIEAVTQTTDWLDKPFSFAVVLPEAAFRRGRNQVDILLIESKGGNEVLSYIGVPTQDHIRIARDKNGEDVLVSESGKSYSVREGAVMGHLDFIRRQAGAVRLSGWAVDRTEASPASSIIIFAGDKQISMGEPTANRQDLVKVFGTSGVLNSGFAFTVPQYVFSQDSKLRVFGIARDGTASELVVNEQAQTELRGLGL